MNQVIEKSEIFNKEISYIKDINHKESIKRW